MTSHDYNYNESLNAKQNHAVVAYMIQTTDAAVANQVGVKVRTIQRWKKLPAFKKALRDNRVEAFGRATSLAHNAAVRAIQSLVEIMERDDSKDAVKVSAANAILKHARQSMELDDLQARVDELSKRIEGNT